VIGFVSTVYNGSELEGEIEVVVGVLQGELSEPVVVRVSTADGTALTSLDYDSINQTLIFSSDTTTHSIRVPIMDDQIDEIDEDIFARLQLESDIDDQNVQIEPNEANLLILDNDGKLLTFFKRILLHLLIYRC